MKDKQPPQTFPADAETINALVDGMGALIICLANQMNPEQKQRLASDLARLSASATASGKTIQGRLIADLSRAAGM